MNEDALPAQAEAEHLAGDQWGMKNEPATYPGQAWLWLYIFWYQMPARPFSCDNADVAVALVMVVLTARLFLSPVILDLKLLPRCVRIYRIIWRDHYREIERGQPEKAYGQMEREREQPVAPFPVGRDMDLPRHLMMGELEESRPGSGALAPPPRRVSGDDDGPPRAAFHSAHLSGHGLARGTAGGGCVRIVTCTARNVTAL